MATRFPRAVVALGAAAIVAAAVVTGLLLRRSQVESLEWCEIVTVQPDACMVEDESLRVAIGRDHLPWKVRDRATGIAMVLIPSAAFGFPHRPMYAGQCEVTREQYLKVCPDLNVTNVERWSTSPGDNLPVDGLSYDDVRRFLSRTGLRLLTETEWMAACSAGDSGEHWTGRRIDDIAWYQGNSGARLHAVGEKRPNGLGLFDMIGNVSEWTSSVVAVDKVSGGEILAVKGGAFSHGIGVCGNDTRPYSLSLDRWSPTARDSAPGGSTLLRAVGIRVARDP